MSHVTVHTKEKTLCIASECKSLQGHPSLRAPVRNHYRGVFVECGKPFSTSVRVTEQKTRRYSEHNYCGKALNVLSVSKKHEDLSRREGPVECHQSWTVIFPHSLGNWEFTADTCEYKDQGNALNNTSYIRKNTKFGCKTCECINFEKSFSDSLLICENLHWRQTLDK